MKKNLIRIFASLFVVAFVLASCTEEEILKSDYDYTPVADQLPTVTLVVGEVTGASVECTGTITFNGDTTILEKGFVCAEDLDFTVGVVSASSDSANYHSVVTGIKELTGYFVKAYVITKNGIAYSDVATFSTPMLKNPLVDFVGTYIQSDYKFADLVLEAAYQVEFIEIEGNTQQLLLRNFWDGGEDILVGFNLANKTISIAPQNIYTSATYGETKAYPYNGTAVDKTGTPVTGTISDEGVITIVSWSASVTAGSFGYYSSSTFVPATNDLAGTYTEVDYLADGSIEATYVNGITIAPVPNELTKISIHNLWDGGDFEITAVMDFAAGTFSIDPQVIYQHATYGDCYIYPYNVSADTVDKTGTAVTGTIEADGSLTVGSWAATVDAGTFGRYSKSTLTKSILSGVRANMKLIHSPSESVTIHQPKVMR